MLVSDENPWVNPVLVIIGNRFGIKSVDAHYFNSIKRYMKLKQFVGLVGGKPGNAYYFCGLLESPTESNQKNELNKLVYLDPHKVRPSSDTRGCKDPRVLHMS